MIDRRVFLQLAAMGCLDAALSGTGAYAAVPTTKGPKGKVLLCLKPTEPGKSKIRIYDWDTGAFEDVDVPLGLIHSAFQDRSNQKILYVFEIFGSVARMDLSDHSYVKVDHQKSPDLFNGHGAQSLCTQYLACTELTNGRSFVTLRSAQTLKLVAKAPVECDNCHQVVGLPESALVAVGNLRGLDKSQTGGITFYDYQERKVKSRIDFPLPVLHLLPLSSTEVIGLTLLTKWHGKATPDALRNERSSADNIRVFGGGQKFTPGPLYYAKTDGTRQVLWDPDQQDLFMDNFGLAGVSSKSFLSGHHGSGKVILWKDLKMAKVFSVPDAKNLVASADGTEFMALSNETLKIFSLETFQEIPLKARFPQVVALSSYRT